MSKIRQNIINAVMNTNKEVLTQNEILELVNKVTEDTQIKFIECGDIKLNRNDMTISINDVKTKLRKTDFELIVYLIDNKNKVVNRDLLIRDVWGKNVIVGSRTIDVSICYLRSIIGKEKIKTIKKVGYLFADVK